MKKGLSPIVSAILILLIAISVTLLAIIWLPKFIIKIFPQLGFNESYVRSRGCLSIENVKGLFGLFTIKNCGKVALSDFSFFIDSNFINKLNIGTLEPSQTIDFYDMPITGGRHSLYITADYAESPPYAVDVPYWECIGGEPILVEDWYVSKEISCICSYNTVIPVNGNVYVIENGRLSLYNCILQFEYMRIRDNGFLNLTKTKIRSIDGNVAFLDDSDVYILDSVFNQVSTWFEHASNATVINSKLYGISINSNIHHKITFSDFDATNSPITEFVKAEDSNFTLNLTNVSFDYSSLQISDNSNTTVRNSAFSDFYIASEENHNLTVNNWNEDTTQDLYFKAQGSDFTFDAKNFYGGWTLFYGVDNSNNTVTNSNIGQLEAYDNSINTFINSSIDTVYLFHNTINTFKNSNLNSNFFVGTRWEDSDNFVKANFSNTTISNSISFDTSYYFPSRTSNITIFGNVTFDSSVYIGRFYANVTRNLPTIIKDSSNYPFPTDQPAKINLTNKFNKSIWSGSVSGGGGAYYFEDPIAVFNRSNYGSGNFTMKVSQVCENKTDVNFLNSTPLEFTINRSYNYDGTFFSISQVGGTRRGMAFDNSYFWIASSNQNVYKYASSETYAGTFNSSKNGLRDVASNGTYLWLLNDNNTEKRVYRYRTSDYGYDNWNFDISAVLEPYAVDFDGENFWVLNGSSVFKYNSTGYNTGFNFSLSRLQTPLYYPDIVFSGGLWILTNTSSAAKGSGVFRYKVDGTFDNWYFEVAPTVNTGRGLAFNGTYFWVMNATGNVYRYSLNKNCLEIMKTCDEFITFLPYTISKNNYRYCLLYDLYMPSQTAIKFAPGVQNSILDCSGHNIGSNSITNTYGVYLTGSSTKNNTIKNCNITDFLYGIYLYSGPNNNTINNNTVLSNTLGIRLTSSNNNTVYNNTAINNSDDGITLSSASYNKIENIYLYSFTDSSNDGIIYLSASNYNNITQVTIAGNTADGFYLTNSNNSNITNSEIRNCRNGIYLTYSFNNTITNINSSSNSYGFYLWSSSNNNIANNAIKSNNNGIYLGGSNNNDIRNGSISNVNYDYVVEIIGETSNNNFTNTNFTTTRKIRFDDSVSRFNYNNRTDMRLWLKTNVSAAATITRKLLNWSTSLIRWNDTFSNTSGSIIARYNITGLLINIDHNVYNNSDLVYTINSGPKGEISFTINLTASQEREIKVNRSNNVLLFNLNESVGVKIYDKSIFGNNGTYYGETFNDGVSYSGSSPTDLHTTYGKYGRALSFDGINDYANFSNSSSLSTASLTVMLWLNLSSDPNCDANNNWRSLIRKGNIAGTNTGWDVVLEDDRSLKFDIGNGTSWQNRVSTPSETVPINSWVHIAFVYDRNTGNQIIYKNGSLIADRVLSVGFMQPNTQPVLLSKGNNAVACPNQEGYINGTIDDVRMWDRSLTQTEIQSEMNSTLPFTRPVVSYSFEESGSYVNDTHIWVNGTYGSALSFDGKDDYIEIKHNDSISGFTEALTASFWIRPNDVTRRQAILNKYNSAVYQRGWFVESNGDNLGFFAAWPNGINYSEWHYDYNPIIGTWYYITLVWETDKQSKFYVNGNPVATGTSPYIISQIYNNIGIPLLIGKSPYASGREFNGTIDEIRVWDRALSQAEILAEKNKG